MRYIRFYSYAVRIKGIVVYVGKGSDTDSRSRVKQYFGRSLRHITKGIRKIISEARSNGDEVRVDILEEFQVRSQDRRDVLAAEKLAYESEARYVAEHAKSGHLANRTAGGSSGNVSSDSTRMAMSASQLFREPSSHTEDSRKSMSDAKRGTTLGSLHRDKISSGLALYWASNRNKSVYSCTAEQLRAVPEFRRASNALFKLRDDEEKFLIANSGSSYSKLKEALDQRFGRKVSTCAVYFMLKRYGLKFRLPIIGSKSELEDISLERTKLKMREKRWKKKGIEEDMKNEDGFTAGIPEEMLGDNRTVFIVTGASGSGKSWVASRLSGVHYVDYDKLRTLDARLIALADATKQKLPIVFDPVSRVTTFINKNPLIRFRLACIIETEETIAHRLKLRGSVKGITPGIQRRIKRTASYAKNHAEFSGTSDQVLAWLSDRTSESEVPTNGSVSDSPVVLTPHEF